MMANELAVEQEENSFSTQLVLDPKLNRPMSIQEHINRDRMKKIQSEKPMSILDHILHEANEFNNVDKLDEEVCKLDDYCRFRDKLIRDYLAECTPRKEQVESYSEDKYDDESLCLDEVFQDDWDTHIPPKGKVELYCENVCEDDEPLFLDILFKDECNHGGEKTCVKDATFRVPVEKRKLDLSISL